MLEDFHFKYLMMITKEWLATRLDNIWTKSLADTPWITEGALVRFIVSNNKKLSTSLTLEQVKNLKSQKKGYKSFRDGHVHNVQFCGIEGDDNQIICRASVVASMRQTSYKTHVLLEKGSGSISGSHCECVAGNADACSHAVAVVFAIRHFKICDLDATPDPKTCTDIPCRWTGVASEKTAPALWDDIQFVQYDPAKGKQPKATLERLNFDPRHPDDRTKNQEALHSLHKTLSAQNTPVPFTRYAIPLPLLPDDDYAEDENLLLDYRTASPDRIRTACNILKASLHLDNDAADSLEQQTRTQSNSTLWHKSRKYRLTASIFHRIKNMRRTTNPKKFLYGHLYEHGHQTADMKFGLKKEGQSAERYKFRKELEGQSITLHYAGLHVSRTKCFLGASADRVAEDSSRRRWLVELKNPRTTWSCHNMVEVQKKQACLKLDSTSPSGVKLNTAHAYYTQIQGQLHIYNYDYCDFVLCTEHAIYVERVNKDEDFCKEMEEKLEVFYDNIFLPKVVCPRVKYGLDPIDLRKL